MARDVPIEAQKFIDVYTDPTLPIRTNVQYAKDFKTTRNRIAEWLDTYEPEIKSIQTKNEIRAFSRMQKNAFKAIDRIEKIADKGTSKDMTRLKANETILNRVFATRTATDITSEGKAIVNIGFAGSESEAGNG
jgi:hypothetical protein